MKEKFEAGFFVKSVLVFAVFLLFLSVQSVSAGKIAGVEVPSSVTVENKLLVLNGAGIRKKLFIKVYVGALYLTSRRSSVADILADPGAKQISMNFLYKEVSDKKLVAAWNEGFRGNNKPVELKPLQERINKFNSLFTTVRKGDEIRLDYLPEEGTKVWINDALKGTIPGEDFSRAVLKIWLGRKPADENLKDAMLGNTY